MMFSDLVLKALEQMYHKIQLINILLTILILMVPYIIQTLKSALVRKQQSSYLRKQKIRHSRAQIIELQDLEPCFNIKQKIQNSLIFYEQSQYQKSHNTKTIQKNSLCKMLQSKIRIKQISKGVDQQVHNFNPKHSNPKRNIRNSSTNMTFMEKLYKIQQYQLDSQYTQKLNEILNVAIKITTLEQNQLVDCKRLKKGNSKNKQQLTVVYVPQKNDFQYIFENNHKLDYEMQNCQNKLNLIDILDCYLKLRKDKTQIYQGNYYKLIQLCLKFDLIEWSAYFLREIYLKKIEVKKEILDEFIKKNFANKLQQCNEEYEQMQKKYNSHKYENSQSNDYSFQQEINYFTDYDENQFKQVVQNSEIDKSKGRGKSWDENYIFQNNSNFYKLFFKDFENDFTEIQKIWKNDSKKQDNSDIWDQSLKQFNMNQEDQNVETTIHNQFYLGKKLSITSKVFSPQDILNF